MKLLCPISGISWNNELFSHARKSSYQLPHPIFSLNFAELEAIYSHQFCRTLLNATETRLLALALFNRTGLIIWESPAATNYNLRTALKAIPALISTNKMLTDNSYNYDDLTSIFARCRISLLNNDMEVMLSMVTEWRQNYHDEFLIDWRIKHDLEAREKQLESLSRLIRTEYRNPSKYIKHLSEYIIGCLSGKSLAETLSFDAGKILRRDYFKYLIQYSGNVETGSYTYPITSEAINSLMDMMIEQLDYENIFCFAAMELLNNMLKTGAYNRYGLSSIIASEADIAASEAAIIAWIAQNPEPIKGNYPTYTEYFLAKNKWIIARSSVNNSIILTN